MVPFSLGPILVGIDGSNGEESTEAYMSTYLTSFVSKICQRNLAGDTPPNKRYFMGPSAIMSRGLDASIDAGYKYIKDHLPPMELGVRFERPILLTGHSRGGLGVNRIARLLQRDHIAVEAMLLFDAVNMHHYYG